MTKHPANIDVSVLLLFHARADHFSKVWEQVRVVRPSRLFLYQDGPRRPLPTSPREGDVADEEAWDPTTSKDWAGIQACRALVSDENIDWECDVHRLYQEKNYGCDPSEFLSQRWAFSLTDKCIVLEDDDVPSQSFFPFCKEMLDRYENDERITMIAGFNVAPHSSPEGELSTPNGNSSPRGGQEGASYFFTRAFSIWGWASWARVVNNWDGDYGFVKDPEQFARLQQKAAQYHQRREMVRLCQQHAAEGKEFYETIFWAYMMLHDGLAIMPSVNQINNIGLDGGTHYTTQLDLIPKRLRWQFVMPRYEMQFPLTHPAEVVEDAHYQDTFYLCNAWNHPWRKVQYSIEELWLNLRHGNFGNIKKAVINRIKKTLNR